MLDYDKLGWFYLGKRFDLEQNRPSDEKLNYESKDLTTHAVCVGMTGSGKTGLCLSVLEEAALDGVLELLNFFRPIAPLREARLPLLRFLFGERLDGQLGAAGIVHVHPGLKGLGLQFGKLEQEIGDVALGVNQNRREAGQRRLFQQIQTQAGLAAARHAHAHGVRR